MIKSRINNQNAAKKAIDAYLNEHSTVITRNDLISFIKYLSAQLLIRVQDDDCYFVDMLEDLERLNND